MFGPFSREIIDSQRPRQHTGKLSAKRAVPRRLQLELLEDRTLPATLDLTGTTLTFTLDAGAAATLDGSPTSLTFDAGAGHTISTTGLAGGNGFASGGQTSTGSLTTAVAVTAIKSSARAAPNRSTSSRGRPGRSPSRSAWRPPSRPRSWRLWGN